MGRSITILTLFTESQKQRFTVIPYHPWSFDFHKQSRLLTKTEGRLPTFSPYIRKKRSRRLKKKIRLRYLGRKITFWLAIFIKEKEKNLWYFDSVVIRSEPSSQTLECCKFKSNFCFVSCFLSSVIVYTRSLYRYHQTLPKPPLHPDTILQVTGLSKGLHSTIPSPHKGPTPTFLLSVCLKVPESV